jgi:hypothetical protein
VEKITSEAKSEHDMMTETRISTYIGQQYVQGENVNTLTRSISDTRTPPSTGRTPAKDIEKWTSMSAYDPSNKKPSVARLI